MDSVTVCPGCGRQVTPDMQYCSFCGTELKSHSSGDQGEVLKTYSSESPGTDQKKGIDQTKTGILFMICGMLLSWIPIILYLGDLLMFIGLIYLTLGRNVFGSRHGDLVLVSWMLLVLFVIGTVAIAASVGESASSIINSPGTSETILKNLLLGAIIVGSFAGLATIILVAGLSRPVGFLVLCLGFAAQIAIGLYIYFVFSPLFSQAIMQAVTSHSTTPISNLEANVNIYRLLDAIPEAIFALGYYLAWSRITDGQIPASAGTEQNLS